MATIITLQAQRADRPPPIGRPGGATILFFTGVRYVRDDADLDTEPAAECDDAADDQSVQGPGVAVN